MQAPRTDKVEIVKDFNATIKNLIAKLEKKSRSEVEIANLDRLKKRLALLRSTTGDNQPLILATPFLMEYKEEILQRNEAALMQMNFRAEVEKRNLKVTKQDEFAFELSDSIREHYKKSSQVEKDSTYTDLKNLFMCCLEYKMLH